MSISKERGLYYQEKCEELQRSLANIEMKQEIEKLQLENKQLKNTLKEILRFCNYLHNDCKYRLNDGYIRKIRNICKKALNEEKKVKENEN